MCLLYSSYRVTKFDTCVNHIGGITVVISQQVLEEVVRTIKEKVTTQVVRFKVHSCPVLDTGLEPRNFEPV